MDPERITADIAAARRDWSYRVAESTCECTGCMQLLKDLGDRHFNFAESTLKLITQLTQELGLRELALSVGVLGQSLGAIAERVDRIERDIGTAE